MLYKLLPAMAASVALIAGGAAYAASTQPYGAAQAPSAPAQSKTAPATKLAVAHSPESIQCSKEADTRNLHGKDRKKFRAECKSALKAHKPIPDTKS